MRFDRRNWRFGGDLEEPEKPRFTITQIHRKQLKEIIQVSSDASAEEFGKNSLPGRAGMQRHG